MLQSSKPDNRVWAKPIGSMIFDDLQSDTSSLDSTTISDEGKFSMMEFAFQYFRQEYVAFTVSEYGVLCFDLIRMNVKKTKLC